MAFTPTILARVWAKAIFVSDVAEIKGFRKDQCGAWIRRRDYGNRNSAYGWEVDHITPVSEGGGDEPSNLRPLNWHNNVATGDGRLACAVTSRGNRNVFY